jgi:hypothetical protein
LRPWLPSRVAAGLGLDHRGDAGRRQPRQQDRGFDLRRRHRRPVQDRQRIACAIERQRQAATLAACAGLRTHQFQGIEDPPHRPAPQRGVAVEDRGNRAAGDRPHHQPTAGTGIAEIQRRFGLREPGHADTAHRPCEIAGPIHFCAECLHGLGGIEHVFALEQPGNPGFADGKRAQDQGPVRDRLVAGNADFSGQGTARTGFKRRRVIRMGQDCGPLRGRQVS